MAHRIQNRRDILSNWNAVNPVLADGEIGFIKDTNELVIGNGVDTFSNLSRISVVEAVGYQSGYNKIQIDGIDALTGSEIVEEGTNANGSYVKYENGLMICLYSYSKTLSKDNYLHWDFPTSFSEEAKINLEVKINYSSTFRGYNIYLLNDTNYTDLLTKARYQIYGLDTLTVTGYFYAIGRWK